MSDLADPDELERLASRVAYSAAAMRRTAPTVSTAAQAARWQSQGATSFHARARADADVTLAQSADLDAIAAALRAGARQVRAELERRRLAANHGQPPRA